jgi:hypothetical protein
MAKYRARLPQLSNRLFLTDGGIETSLIYLDGFELPMFAAFDLFKNETGRQGLRDYYAATHRSRMLTASASFWKVRPGGPIPIGAANSATRRQT